MFSLFVSKLNRASTGGWDPNKFKIDGTEYISEEEEEELENDQYQYHNAAYPGPYHNAAYPSQYHTSLHDPKLFNAMDYIPPEMSQYIQPSRQTRQNFRQIIKPQETANLSVNPVENLESAYAVKTGPSAPQQLREEWSNRYCEDAIPSKYLTKSTVATYELMGLNEAQRRSRPMGEGVPNIGPAIPFDRVNSLNYGQGQTQFSTVSHELYHEDFATLGGPPAVYTGIYTDPLTGIQYDTYENAMPPPDGDWYDMSYAPGKNRKLDCLQGGWSNNTPIPPRREILEGDWNQHYDRGVNTFGGSGSYGDVLRCRQLDNFERSTRFTLNDFTPDNEAPELEGVPANVDGIYGNVKVRFTPNLAGTNRGHDEETTFRTGLYGIDIHNQHMAQQYTKMPQCIQPLDYVGPVCGAGGVYGEQSRSDYNPSLEMRGLEATNELTEHGVGFVDSTGEQSRSDYNIPHKLTGLEVNPELSEHGVNGNAFIGQNRSEYNAPTKQLGMDVYPELSTHGVNDGGAQGVHNRSEYNAPTKQLGMDVYPELSPHGVNDGGAQGVHNRSEYNAPTKQLGMDVYPELSTHGVNDGGAQGVQNRGDYNTPHKTTGTTVNSELSEHGVGYVDTYGDQERSDYNTPHKTTGTTVNSELSEHGVSGGAFAGQNRKALTRNNRIALLKSMQGAFKSGTDAPMNRVFPTRFNDKKNTSNKVLVPSRMSAGLGGPQTVERIPTNWSHRRTPTTHRPSEERVGAVSKSGQNETPLIGQMPVKFETDTWRMGPAHDTLGSANDMLYSTIIRAQGPCVTY